MKAMILSAGLGTRLKPFTDQHPKALLPVNGKSLLQRNIEYLASFGINEIIVNVHHFAGQLQQFIKEYKQEGVDIKISDESDELLETGGGLKKASWFFDDKPFVVMNVDILTDMDLDEMIHQHHTTNPLATLAVTNRVTARYFLFDEMENLCGWKNERNNEQKMSRDVKVFTQKAFSGIHIISPEIFSLIKMEGKFSMVDVYLALATTHNITAFDHSNSKFIDVGRPENVVIAEEIF